MSNATGPPSFRCVTCASASHSSSPRLRYWSANPPDFKGGGRREPRDPPRRDPGPRGRIRLRQDHRWARTLLRLYEPDEGEIFFNGVDVTGMKGAQLRRQRRDFQMIFQDPYSSLNPRKTVRATLGEVLTVHGVIPKGPGRAEADRAAHLYAPRPRRPQPQRHRPLPRRILRRAAAAHRRRPRAGAQPVLHRGGRAGLRAGRVHPGAGFEPLDRHPASGKAGVSVHLHDLRVVRLISHRVAVMYLGRIIETSPTEDLYERPRHPYTEILIKAAPVLDAKNRNRDYAIEGEPPSPVNLPTGCRFHPRCPYAREECRLIQPELREIAPGCFAACHFPRNT